MAGQVRRDGTSGNAPISEGGIPGEAAGQQVSRCGKFLTDKTQPEEPSPHRVFRVLALLGSGADGLEVLCHLAERQTKLDVTLELSRVKAALALCCRPVELEEPELDRALCDCLLYTSDAADD